MTTEASGRSTASVDAAKREIPVGLRQLNPGTGNSWRAGTKMMLTGTWEQLAGVIVQGRYRLRTLLYSGRRQAEYLATVVSPNSGTSSDPGATRVSVTLMNLEPPEAERQLAEIARARKLEHPNLLRVLDGGTCSIEGAELVYVVTEVPQNTLAQALEVGPLPQAALSDLLHDIIAGLEYVHAQNLVYRLDPQGIVRAESRWKLADPSQVHAAGEFSAEEAAVPGPTRAVPPEAAEGKILPAWDVWALGVMLEDAAGGPSSRGAALPQPYEAVVRACREADPARRISLAEIRRQLDPEPPAAIHSPRLPAPPQRALPVPASRRHRWIAPVAACFVLFGVALVWMKGRQQQEIAQQTTTAPPPPQPVPQPSQPADTAPPTGPPAASAQNAPPAVTPPPAMPEPKTEAKARPAVKSEAPKRKRSGSGSSAFGAQVGLAIFASEQLEGRVTASGEPFHSSALTAAHRQFPLGTRLRVTNLSNRRSVEVRVNDRAAFRPGVIISLTRQGAEELGFAKSGSARVRVEPIH